MIDNTKRYIAPDLKLTVKPSRLQMVGVLALDALLAGAASGAVFALVFALFQ